MRITITYANGTTTEVDRLEIRDGDIFHIKGKPSYEEIAAFSKHLYAAAGEKRVLVICGPVQRIGKEERRALLRQLQDAEEEL